MKFPVTFTGFSSKSDGSASLRFGTQEITSDEFSVLKQNLNSFGWMAFAAQESEIELPKEPISDETKKPSARLRAVLFLLWKKKGEDGDFNAWYRGQIELIIDRIKSKLE